MNIWIGIVTLQRCSRLVSHVDDFNVVVLRPVCWATHFGPLTVRLVTKLACRQTRTLAHYLFTGTEMPWKCPTYWNGGPAYNNLNHPVSSRPPLAQLGRRPMMVTWLRKNVSVRPTDPIPCMKYYLCSGLLVLRRSTCTMVCHMHPPKWMRGQHKIRWMTPFFMAISLPLIPHSRPLHDSSSHTGEMSSQRWFKDTLAQ